MSKKRVFAVTDLSQGEFTRLITGALQTAFGDKRWAVKLIADAANSNERSAKNWLGGKNAPDSLHLLRLATEVPEVEAVVRELCGWRPRKRKT